MPEDELGLGVLNGELLDAPRQREDRVTAVDERRVITPDQLFDERMDRGVVGVIGIEQRMHLHAEELRVIEQLHGLLEEPRDARIGPHEAVRAGDGLDDLPDILIVRMEHHPGAQSELLHRRCQLLSGHPHVEEREIAHVHMGVDDRRRARF